MKLGIDAAQLLYPQQPTSYTFSVTQVLQTKPTPKPILSLQHNNQCFTFAVSKPPKCQCVLRGEGQVILRLQNSTAALALSQGSYAAQLLDKDHKRCAVISYTCTRQPPVQQANKETAAEDRVQTQAYTYLRAISKRHNAQNVQWWCPEAVIGDNVLFAKQQTEVRVVVLETNEKITHIIPQSLCAKSRYQLRNGEHLWILSATGTLADVMAVAQQVRNIRCGEERGKIHLEQAVQVEDKEIQNIGVGVEEMIVVGGGEKNKKKQKVEEQQTIIREKKQKLQVLQIQQQSKTIIKDIAQNKLIKQQQINQVTEIKKQKITVLVCTLVVYNQQQIVQVKIQSQNQSHLIYLPKAQKSPIQINHAITFIKSQCYTIKLKSLKNAVFQGVFLCIPPKKVKIYDRTKQIAQLYLNQSFLPQQVTVQILHKSPLQQPISVSSQQYPHYSEPTKQPVRSPYMRFQILNCTPSVRSLHLSLTTLSLHYPIEQFCILPTTDNFLLTPSLQLQPLTILNHQGISTYSLLRRRDKSIAYLLKIRISQSTNTQYSPHPQRYLLTLKSIISLTAFPNNNYQPILMHQNTFINLPQVAVRQGERVININQAVWFNAVTTCTLKLTLSKKTSVCEFDFDVKMKKDRIKDNVCVVSLGEECRLVLSVLRIAPNPHCRMNKIQQVFQPMYVEKIRTCMQEQCSIREVLQRNTNLTYSQVEILLQIITEERIKEVFQVQQVQRRIQYSIHSLIQQFRVFDINNCGRVQRQYCNIVLKTILKVAPQLKQLHWQQILDQYECDESIDYLYQLFKLRNTLTDDFFVGKHIVQKELVEDVDSKAIESIQLRVVFIGYHNCSLDSNPLTLQFKIRDGSDSVCLLTNAIPRSYSYKYLPPYPQKTFDNNQLMLEVYSKSLTANGDWKVQLLEKKKLQEKVEVLGGYAEFKIERIGNQVRHEVSPKINPALKSLRETTQQWRDRKKIVL